MKILIGVCVLVCAVACWSALVYMALDAGYRQDKVELKDGRTVICLQARGFGKSISCDWAGAK